MAGFNSQTHHKLWRLNNLVTSTLLSGLTKPIIFILHARCNLQMNPRLIRQGETAGNRRVLLVYASSFSITAAIS